MKKPRKDDDDLRLREVLPYEQQAQESYSIMDRVEERSADSTGAIRRRGKQ